MADPLLINISNSSDIIRSSVSPQTVFSKSKTELGTLNMCISIIFIMTPFAPSFSHYIYHCQVYREQLTWIQFPASD